jgi:uncharacterized membrane protein YdbT with pleckstrin-like domain
MTSQTAALPGAFEIEQALFSTLLVNAFGSFYWVSVLLHLAPWRSTLGAAGLVTVVALGWDLERNPLPFLAAWAISATLFVTELTGRRTFVTATDIVVRSGLFGRRSKAYPLREVSRVSYQYPWFGQSLHVGDLEILGEGWALSLVGVKFPEENAQRLLDQKNRT